MTAAFSPQQQAWKNLLEQPLAFVATPRLRECWPPTLTDQQHAALGSTPRFHDRVLALLMRHFQLSPLALAPLPNDDDLPVLLLAPETFKRLPRLCGAIWHAATLSREIRSDVVAQLRSALGPEVFTQALAHRSLAGAADLLRNPAELVEAIDRDGASCVSAWLQQQPAGLREWLSLRLEVAPVSGPPANGSHTAFDPAIVRRAAMTFDPLAEELAS